MNKIVKEIIMVLIFFAIIVSFNTIYATEETYTLEQYLLDTGYDLDKNGELSQEELDKITSLIISGGGHYTVPLEVDSLNLEMISRLKNLTKLMIYSDTITMLDMSGIGELTNLTELRIWSESLNTLDMNNITKVANLENLWISCDAITTIDMSNIDKLTSLSELRIWGDNLRELDMSKISNLTNLNKLWIISRFADLQTSNLDKLTNLSSLILQTPISSVDTNAISKLTKLNYLEIESYKVTSLNMKDIFCLNNLEYLCIICDGLSSIDLSEIYKLSNLKELHVCGNKLESINLAAIAELKKLEILFIEIDQVESVNLDPIAKLNSLISFTCLAFNTEGSKFEDLLELNKIEEISICFENFAFTPLGDQAEEIHRELKEKLGIETITFDGLELNMTKLENAKILNGFNFKEGTTVKDFIEKLKITTEYDVKIENLYGSKLSDDDLIGTGCRIVLSNGEEFLEYYTLIYYGDVDGNGKINAIDALAIIKNKNGIAFNDATFEEAGRVTGTSEVPSALDALAIIKHGTGKYTINQNHENALKYFPSDYIQAVG